MKISQRSQQLEPSVTLAAAARAKELKAQGIDVKSLTVGEPDFTTPKNIQDAAIKAIQSGVASFYTPSAGIPELRRAIITYLKTYYHDDYDISEVMVTDGAKFALYALFQAILDDGDEVIIPTPYWVSYAEQVKLAQGKPIFVAAQQENQLKVVPAQLEAVRTEKTKAIIINSPSNPTGVVYSKEELAAIGQWAVTHDILIVADDIYGRLVYDGVSFTPISTISKVIKEHTIVISGVSKSYSMTGWRIGYAAGNKEIIKAMSDIASQSTSNPAAVSQYAAVEALTGPQESVETMRQTFEERRDRMYPILSAIPGFVVDKPQGAFYFFPNVRQAMDLCGFSDVNDFVEALLNEAHVAVVTGAGFGSEDHIRMSYAADWETLEESCRRIKTFVEEKAKKA